MTYDGIKRRVFISHFRDDIIEVDSFIDYFANQEGVFTPYVLGANDNDNFINSTKTDYVMQRIRGDYLRDSTVTIALIGSCTHSRRYIDWEIKSSLTQGESDPNGLIGILLPSQGKSAFIPPRLKANWNNKNIDCYARFWSYPSSVEQLGNWIEDAYSARTNRAEFIQNSQDVMIYNTQCRICGLTH